MDKRRLDFNEIGDPGFETGGERNVNFLNENSKYIPKKNYQSDRFSNNNFKGGNFRRPYDGNRYQNRDFNNRLNFNDEGEGRNNFGGGGRDPKYRKHYSNFGNSSNGYGSSYYPGRNNMLNSEMNEILNKIHKVYNRVTEKDIREIILYQRLTHEEIINMLVCKNEINKQLEKNDFDSKNSMPVHNSPNVEAREDPAHLEELCIESLGEMIRRPLFCDHNFNFNYVPELCTNDHHDEKSRKNCTSSHNSLEVEVHYLRYKTKYCKDKGCKNDCFNAHGFTDFRYLPELLGNEQGSRKDFNLLKKDIKESKLFKNIIVIENVTPLPDKFDLKTYKVIKCPMGESCFVDYHYCYNYHNEKERRRNPKFFQCYKKKFCPKVISSDGKVGDPSKCEKGDFCEYFHTRNENNYDPNFFQRNLECKRNKGKPCEFFEVCYGTHVNEKGNKITYSASLQKDEGINQIKSTIEEAKKKIQKTLDEIAKSDTMLVEIDKYQIYKCHNPECTQVFSEKMCWLKCKHNFCTACCDSVNKENKRYCLACDAFQSAFIFDFKEIANSK